MIVSNMHAPAVTEILHALFSERKYTTKLPIG